ncbi:MAG: xanthine dehydrogenase family protein subunit M [Ignavibacteriales bacterium]|nr:xanthine dehydrogenase family protein subunit M [Ignavibacteriales bacterium]
MKPFEYKAVNSVEEACSVLAEYGSDARILAGGTDLLIEFRKQNVRTPKVVIDISFIKEIHSIESPNGTIIIRPLVTHSEIVNSKVVQQYASLLTSAALVIGSPQIRNRGTVGGNIMNAATCADTVPPLIALGAKVTLESKAGSRQLDLSDLFIKPYQTKAKHEEILTEIHFTKLPPNAKSSFIKLGRRNALAISRLSVAAILTQDKNGKITDARIVPGAALPVWKRVTEAEKILIGEKPSIELFTAAGQKVSEVLISHTGRRWSTEYKEPVIAVLVRRALEQCTLTPNPSPKLGEGSSDLSELGEG